MYKLTVVSGPNRGSSYPAHDGEISIGRQSGNTIVLPSSKISKNHCSFLVNGDDIQLKDLGSSNGTFVNGVLVKMKQLKLGDRVTIGEYVLELSKSVKSSSATPPSLQGFGQGFGQIVQMPGVPSGGLNTGLSDLGGISLAPPETAPKDLKGKIIWYFEKDFMPIFYGMNLKYEWRFICMTMFSAFVVGTVIISIYPLLESNRSTVIKETERRASFIAKQVAERNVAFLAAKAETQTESGSAEQGAGVRVVVLTDLDSRIIAPAARMNQYLSSGPEAIIGVRARDLFRNGRETGIAVEADDSTVVAVEPVKVLNPMIGRNITVAMVIVSIDTTLFTLDLGDMGIVYSQAIILTGLLAALILLVLHRLTLKPFMTLNEDMDKALKGDITQVGHEYKISELNPLWEIINSAVQRIPKSEGAASDFGGVGGGGLGSVISIEEYASPLKALGELANLGLVIFDADRKISQMSSRFEDITGIRSENALGQDISDVARDQAMIAFTSDILSRAPVGGEGISEEFEISGVSFKVYACAFGSPGSSARCYVMAMLKSEES